VVAKYDTRWPVYSGLIGMANVQPFVHEPSSMVKDIRAFAYIIYSPPTFTLNYLFVLMIVGSPRRVVPRLRPFKPAGIWFPAMDSFHILYPARSHVSIYAVISSYQKVISGYVKIK